MGPRTEEALADYNKKSINSIFRTDKPLLMDYNKLA